MVSSNSGGKDDSPRDGGDMGADPSASESGLFSEGEKVYAYHGPLIYEAKVQKVEFRKGEWKYFVHYLGWNKNWDEWVIKDRLLKFNKENAQKKKALTDDQSTEKNTKSGRSTQNKPKSSNDAKADKEDTKNTATRGKKRKVQSGVELVKLPRTPNVDNILKKYLEYRTKKDNKIAESIGEILKGLRCYFDKALPAMLLYKEERKQYRELVVDNVSPSTVYGAEHLLRLFVKLPELLAYVNMDEDASAKLQKKLFDFLKYLEKNQSSFFLSTYDGSKIYSDTDEE
ncbi:hypothetical protein QJS10_CPA02g00378 [Acorus calamus]|uniref:MRG domain-containing protein n=1 Tax=Acorus calamus TaxID=4465 RepID=A0AAV9FDV1_ACOCL|nr:hypothetical protein QJS10_CPA02g00378 [Acorus calamus]